MCGRMETVAYCYNRNRLEVAEMAHSRQSDQEVYFYCPECHVGVVPARSRKNNYFFRALSGHLHQKSCSFYKERIEGNGYYSPQEHSSAEPERLPPTILGAIATQRRIGKPSPSDLPQLIRQAKEAPLVVEGSFEQVVEAWNTMSRDKKRLTPLTINGKQGTYEDRFEFIGDTTKNANDFNWEDKIIYGKTRLTKGRQEGFYFLDSIRKFDVGERERKNLNIVIREKHSKQREKRYIRNLLNDREKRSDAFTLFIHGCRPEYNYESGKIGLSLPNNSTYKGVCVRVNKRAQC